MEAECDFKCRGGTLIIRAFAVAVSYVFQALGNHLQMPVVFERGCWIQLKKRAMDECNEVVPVNFGHHVRRRRCHQSST